VSCRFQRQREPAPQRIVIVRYENFRHR
jgi:hypothetical protein